MAGATRNEAWRSLALGFRQSFDFKENTSHSWFPGHMTKGLKAMQRKLVNIDCVIEVHDARLPLSGRNVNFKSSVSGVRPHILVLNKKDLVSQEHQKEIAMAVKAEDPTISKVIYTNCLDYKCSGLKSVLPTAISLIDDTNRYHRADKPDRNLMVIGIPNVGKSSLINILRNHHLKVGGRVAAVGAKPGITRAVQERIRISDRPLVYLLDTPGISVPFIRNMDVGLKLALCATLQDHLVGKIFIADYLLFYLNKRHNFEYVDYMGLTKPEDDVKVMLAKSAIQQKLFRTFRDMSTRRPRTIPDMEMAAEIFMKGFRTGALGLINLDSDLVEEILSRKAPPA